MSPGASGLHETGQILGAAAALDAACDLGMLDLLAEQPATPADTAARLGLDARMTQLLVAALTVLHVLEGRGDGTFAPAVGVAAVDLQRQLWSGLPAALRTGTPAVDLSRPADDEGAYTVIAPALDAASHPGAGAVLSMLRERGPRILDLGAGSAPWTRRLAATDPTVHVTAVDLPAVLTGTRDALAAAGVAGQFDLVAGDLFTTELGTGFDTVLVAGVCRLLGPDANGELARRAAAAVRPGGRVAIIDALADSRAVTTSSAALHALGLALRTSEGGHHPFSAYASWLYRAGLTGIEVVALDIPDLSLVHASRPT